MKTALLCTLLLVGRSEDVGEENVNLPNHPGVGTHKDGLDTLLAEARQKNHNFEPAKWYPLIGQLEDDFKGKRYTSSRRIKGDGNCFYRAVVFSALERPGRIRDHTIDQLQSINQVQFDGVTGPDVRHAASREALNTWLEHFRKTTVDIEPLYRRDMDLALVRAARALTAQSMNSQSEEIEPFVHGLGYASVRDYCKENVLFMGRFNDLDQTGLSQALNLAVRGIEVNANARGGRVTETLHGAEFQKAGERIVTVILMDGHYSVIYEADLPAVQPIQPAVNPIEEEYRFKQALQHIVARQEARLAQFAACRCLNDAEIARAMA